MPSNAYFLPRASLAPQLGPAGLAEYRARGWHVGTFGAVDSGQVVGPCARCGRPAIVYGRRGRPTCAVACSQN